MPLFLPFLFFQAELGIGVDHLSFLFEERWFFSFDNLIPPFFSFRLVPNF